MSYDSLSELGVMDDDTIIFTKTEPSKISENDSLKDGEIPSLAKEYKTEPAMEKL